MRNQFFYFVILAGLFLGYSASVANPVYHLTLTSDGGVSEIENIKRQLNEWAALPEGDLAWGAPLRNSPYFHFSLPDSQVESLFKYLARIGEIEIDQTVSSRQSPQGYQRFLLWLRTPEAIPADLEILISSFSPKKSQERLRGQLRETTSVQGDGPGRWLTSVSPSHLLDIVNALAKDQTVLLRNVQPGLQNKETLQVRWIFTLRENTEAPSSCQLQIETRLPGGNLTFNAFEAGSWTETDLSDSTLYQTSSTVSLNEDRFYQILPESPALRIRSDQVGTCIFVTKENSVFRAFSSRNEASDNLTVPPPLPPVEKEAKLKYEPNVQEVESEVQAPEPGAPFSFKKSLQLLTNVARSPEQTWIPITHLNFAMREKKFAGDFSHFKIHGSESFGAYQMLEVGLWKLWPLSNSEDGDSERFLLGGLASAVSIQNKNISLLGLGVQYFTPFWSWAEYLFSWLPWEKQIELTLKYYPTSLDSGVSINSAYSARLNAHLLLSEHWRLIGSLDWRYKQAKSESANVQWDTKMVSSGLGLQYDF